MNAESWSLPGRVLGAARLLWGAYLLATPGAAVELLGGQDLKASRRVARILGARQLVQGLIEIRLWPRWRRAGAAVDLAHALSGVALAAGSPRWRRPASRDAAIASSLAAAGILLGRLGRA